MDRYQIKNLGSVSMEELANIHNSAFADYVVPMRTTPGQLEAYFKVSAADMKRSFGVFCGGVLVGFLVNAIDTYEGERVAYDAMTGIVPGHRGKGAFSQLFTHTRKALKAEGISRYWLEVIATNTNAVEAYKSKGAAVVRNLKFFKGRVERAAEANISYEPLKETYVGGELARYKPTFGNRMCALQRDVGNYFLAEYGAVAVICSGQGRVVQIRYAGPADDEALCIVLAALAQRFPVLSVSNIPATEGALIQALLYCGLENTVDQYEMNMAL